MTDYILDTRPVVLSAFGRSDRGQRRPDNQDDFLIVDLSQPDGQRPVLRPELNNGGAASNQFELGPKGALVLVADGMGGAGGSVASRLAATWIHHALLSAWSTETDHTPARFALLLRHAIEDTNRRLHQQGMENPDLRGMGTTTTAVGVLDGYLYLAQVGDSRAYLVRAGSAIQLTRDQSMAQALIDSGALTEEEAGTGPHSTAILQALGVAPSVKVDMTYQEARRGDALVLCSDGLFRVVRRDEIAAIAGAKQDPVEACDTLVALANERGGPDNVTVVVVRLDGDGLPLPAGSEVVGRNVLILPEF